MNKLLKSSLAVLLIVAAALLGCQNMDVDNLNQPDEARALATPSDIESLIQGSFLGWHDGICNGTPNMSLAVMSDTYTCSWGNYSMAALSEEPRTEFQNKTDAGESSVARMPWFDLYGAISAAADGIRAIEAGTVTLGEDNQRAIAFGKFVQGISHGWHACMFDQGFILDEDVDLASGTLDFFPYTEVLAAGIAQLEECIQICNANDFTLPIDWINGYVHTSAQLAQVAHSFIAVFMASVARSPAERQAVDWNTVLSHIDQGITEEWGPDGNGGGRGDPWWHAVQWYSAESNTWNRVDYKLIGYTDPGTQFSDWLALAPPDRDEFIFESSDLRIWDGTYASTGDQNPGSQFKQVSETPYHRSGQPYHKTRYSHYIYDEYRYETSAGSQAPLLRPRQMDLMKAEAYLHLGRAAEAPALIDKTHVVNGGYPSSASAPVGSITDGLDYIKPGVSLWSILQYEKHIECLGTLPGLEYFDRRGFGTLLSLTLLHFPVPALDLETLQLGLYSHGGGVGNSAPKRIHNADDDKLRPGN